MPDVAIADAYEDIDDDAYDHVRAYVDSGDQKLRDAVRDGHLDEAFFFDNLWSLSQWSHFAAKPRWLKTAKQTLDEYKQELRSE